MSKRRKTEAPATSPTLPSTPQSPEALPAAQQPNIWTPIRPSAPQPPQFAIAAPVAAGVWTVPATSPAPQSQEKNPIELKFFQSSSFWSLPVEERDRILTYLAAYRKALPHLLSEGEAGRFAVIKDGEAVHIWDTADDAMQAATLLIGPGLFAIYQVKPQDAERLALGEEIEASCPQ